MIGANGNSSGGLFGSRLANQTDNSGQNKPSGSLFGNTNPPASGGGTRGSNRHVQQPHCRSRHHWNGTNISPRLAQAFSEAPIQLPRRERVEPSYQPIRLPAQPRLEPRQAFSALNQLTNQSLQPQALWGLERPASQRRTRQQLPQACSAISRRLPRQELAPQPPAQAQAPQACQEACSPTSRNPLQASRPPQEPPQTQPLQRTPPPQQPQPAPRTSSARKQAPPQPPAPPQAPSQSQAQAPPAQAPPRPQRTTPRKPRKKPRASCCSTNTSVKSCLPGRRR